MNTKNIEIVTEEIKSLVLSHNISPKDLLIGVHNACAHGELWPKANFGKNDGHLGQIFDGLELSIEGAKKVQIALDKSARCGKMSKH